MLQMIGSTSKANISSEPKIGDPLVDFDFLTDGVLGDDFGDGGIPVRLPVDELCDMERRMLLSLIPCLRNLRLSTSSASMRDKWIRVGSPKITKLLNGRDR
mmetsp:Transcript_6137/g.9364  ORF Transcript_6137/g.9364 Transcript_6137/m.9364 type:complete len:101 (+) Transcript_6137:273-575(+)